MKVKTVALFLIVIAAAVATSMYINKGRVPNSPLLGQGAVLNLYMDDRYLINSDLSQPDASNEIFDDLVFGALLTFDSKGEPTVPYLASSFKVEEGGQTWKFKLRPGILPETVAGVYQDYIKMRQYQERPHPFLGIVGIEPSPEGELVFKFNRAPRPEAFAVPPRVRIEGGKSMHKQGFFKWLPGFYTMEIKPEGIELKRNTSLRLDQDGAFDRIVIRRVPADELAIGAEKATAILLSSDGPRPAWAKEPLVRLEASQTLAVANEKLKNGPAVLAYLKSAAQKTPLNSIFSARSTTVYLEPFVIAPTPVKTAAKFDKLSIVAYGIWSGAEQKYITDLVAAAYGTQVHILFRTGLAYPGSKRTEEDISILQLPRMQRFSLEHTFDLFCAREEPTLPNMKEGLCDVLYKGGSIPKMATDFQSAALRGQEIVPLFSTRAAIYTTPDLKAEVPHGIGRLRFLK